ncbi:MAG: TolC family protein [Gemmatimonadales bacterium]
MLRLRTSLVGLTAGLVAGCATYQAAPVASDALLPRYNTRSLEDPGLRAWFDTLQVAVPAGAWTPRALALAATWLRTDRTVRLAEIRAADAAVITAGERPQPGLSTDAEYAFSNPQADSRWGLAIATAFTVELGGKRGARVGRARAAALATRAGVREGEWRQAGEVYRATLAFRTAEEGAASAAEERLLADSIAALARARYDAGGTTRAELARMEGEALAALADEQAAVRDAARALADLRATIGLPGSAVGVPVANRSWEGCGPLPGDREALQRLALTRSWSVRRAAAEYQVAEGELRIEVANASPDLALGPGLFFDQGTGKFTLGAGLPALLLNRNRGPIAEAEARRAVAGARLEQAQETVLSALDQALATCGRIAGERVTLDSLASASARRVALVEAAWRRGETGWLDVLLARREQERAVALVRAGNFRDAAARLELDLSTGAWGLEADGAWPREGEP